MHWLTEREGWKAIACLAYVFICIFDFVVIPSWYGLMRRDLHEVMMYMPDGDPVIQLEYLRLLTDIHDLLTLKISGLFHVAFGALLTGSAIVGRKNVLPKLDPDANPNNS